MKPPDAPEAPFEAPWQAQVFALAVDLNARGVFTWAEWSAALGAAIAQAPAAAYYERWLFALEQLVKARGLTDAGELATREAAWRRAYETTPHGQPVALACAGSAPPISSDAAGPRYRPG